MEFTLFILRWVHFLAGITWIGILYYFNFVQTPFFAETEGRDQDGGNSKARAASTLVVSLGRDVHFSFRYLDLYHADGRNGRCAILFILLRRDDNRGRFNRYPDVSQRLARNLAQSADRDRFANQVAGGGQALPAAAGAGRRAALTSRTNTVFSIPMLFYMGAASHYSAMVSSMGPRESHGYFWFIVIVLVAAFECNALIGTQGVAKQPLDSVKGALWYGFLLTGILYLLTLGLT